MWKKSPNGQPSELYGVTFEPVYAAPKGQSVWTVGCERWFVYWAALGRGNVMATMAKKSSGAKSK